MPIETATYISQLVPANPLGSDQRSTAANHLRLVKSVLQAQFTNLGTTAVTVTAALLNKLGITATTGTNNTDPATNAFVQQEIANVNAQTGLTYSTSSSTSISITAGQRIALTGVTLVTVTLPASPTAGQQVSAIPCNGLATNVFARNGNNIQGLAEDMTMANPELAYTLIYTAAKGWRMI